MDDYFAVLGLPRRLALNEEELRRRFYELSRQHHPDFHQAGTAAERAVALGASAEVNRAYRTLRDPLARVEYVIALEEGRDGREGARDKPAVPPALLAEMLEVQEALEEAKAAGLDEGARRRLREERGRLLAREEAEQAAILGRMPDWDAATDRGADRRDLREWFKQRLATRAYLRTVIGDLGEALGEEDDARDGAHRRH
jgi:molecular chaperone HscB